MKRSWIGFGLLLVLLILGLLVTWLMKEIHEPVTLALDQAAERIQLGDWSSAEGYFDSARQQWDAWKNVRSCFADHAPVEEIDAGFAELQIYCAARENVAFAAACRELARKVSAVGEAHGLVWRNIL